MARSLPCGVWYLGSREVEYGFTNETWSAWPVDDGTRQVISDGMQILWERGGILSRLRKTSKARPAWASVHFCRERKWCDADTQNVSVV
jgi:hypothetical protein